MYLFSHFFIMTLPSLIKALCYFINNTILVDLKDAACAFISFENRESYGNRPQLFISLVDSLI